MSRDRKERLDKKRKDETHKANLRLSALRASRPFEYHGSKDAAKHRQCGECQACCEVIAIHLKTTLDEPEDKPNYRKCPHQCATGCDIYSDRPTECKSYECIWKLGLLTFEEYRPDKLGVLVDVRDAHGKENITQPVAVFWEVWPGALKQDRVKQLIRFILHNTKLRIMYNEFDKVEKSEDGFIRKRLL